MPANVTGENTGVLPYLHSAAASFDPSPAAARLDAAFRNARQQRRPLLGGCLPVASPGWEALSEAAGLLEVPLPTGDAYMDGPDMRRGHETALDAGWTPLRSVSLAGDLAQSGRPVLVMAYWHTIAAVGAAEMARAVARAGAAGMVIADLPATAAAGWSRIARGEGIHTILLAGTWDPADLAVTARFATGAVYVPAAAGKTGGSEALDPALPEHVALAHAITGLEAVTGVGVNDERRARDAGMSGVSAVIVGSRFLRDAAGPDPARAIRETAARFSAAFAGADTPREARGRTEHARLRPAPGGTRPGRPGLNRLRPGSVPSLQPGSAGMRNRRE